MPRPCFVSLLVELRAMASCVTGSDLHQSAAPPIRVPPPCGPRPRTPRWPEMMARKGVSYVTAAQPVSMVRDPHVAIIDVRDKERIYGAHITGSDHYASDGFADRLPEIAEATRGKETLVFHCALSQWNNLELENFKDKINEVTGVMAAVYGGDHKFSYELAPSPTPSSLFSAPIARAVGLEH